MQKKLYRSVTDRKLAGVCAGIANYIGTYPAVIRISWFLISMFEFIGILAYLICVIVIPEEPTKIIDAN